MTLFRVSKGVKIAVGVVALLLAISVQAAGSDGCNVRKYEDHNQVDYGPLRLSRIVGTAIDETGAPVAKTCAYLFAEKTEHLLASAEVDSDGKFYRTSRQVLIGSSSPLMDSAPRISHCLLRSGQLTSDWSSM